MLIANVSMSITWVSAVEQQQGGEDRQGPDCHGKKRGDNASEDDQ